MTTVQDIQIILISLGPPRSSSICLLTLEESDLLTLNFVH